MADVKICGIKTPEDFKVVAKSGGRWAGLVFYPKSPRHLTLEEAQSLRYTADQTADQADHCPDLVALTVNADDAMLDAIMHHARPEMIQCHGAETPERVRIIKSQYNVAVMKAIRVKDAATLDAARDYDGCADMMLFDSAPSGASLPGGTGHAFDWQLMAAWKGTTPWMLAGGLTPENIRTAISVSGATAVDVSSGVENAAGIKDHAAIQRFVSAAQ